MKINPRESVPILNRDTPTSTKFAALVFLISFCMYLHFSSNVIIAVHMLSGANSPISAEVSTGSLSGLMHFTVTVLVVWALVKGFLIANLFFGRCWAKNTLSVIAVLVILWILLTHAMQPQNASMNLSNNLEHVGEVVAVIFLFTPKSAAWFRLRA